MSHVRVLLRQTSHDRISWGNFDDTVDGRNPAPRGIYKNLVNDGINYPSTGAGFLPSAIWNLYDLFGIFRWNRPAVRVIFRFNQLHVDNGGWEIHRHWRNGVMYWKLQQCSFSLESLVRYQRRFRNCIIWQKLWEIWPVNQVVLLYPLMSGRTLLWRWRRN